MATDCKQYVNTCVTCQKNKNRNTKMPGLLSPIRATLLEEILTIDLVSKFKPAIDTHHEQYLDIVDKFSRYSMLQGCPIGITSRKLARILLARAITLFGVPHKVISDRRPQFTAELWQSLFNAIGSKAALAATH